MILSRPLKTTRCSSFILLFLVKALAFAIRDMCFTLRCLQLLVQLIHCPRLGCATAFFAVLFACL